ncbi:MAG: hypothetical protein FWF84_02900 [Kiritimatiellaeota bacterium]|nr:hypothetical protein [Kiritimatiellota bacterium]
MEVGVKRENVAGTEVGMKGGSAGGKGRVWGVAVVSCVLVFVSGCTAVRTESVEHDAVLYQWVTPNEGMSSLYAIRKATGEVASLNRYTGKWISISEPIDWASISTQQVQVVTRASSAGPSARPSLLPSPYEVEQKAFFEALPQMSVEELVMKARSVEIYQCVGRQDNVNYIYQREWFRHDTWNMDIGITLRLKADVGDVFVKFEVPLENGRVDFYLSSASSDSGDVFPAAETIADDVRAEVLRQAAELNKRLEDARNKR